MKHVFIKSGLLVSVEGRTGEGENFTFHHLLFQQFLAGKFLTSLKKVINYVILILNHQLNQCQI